MWLSAIIRANTTAVMVIMDQSVIDSSVAHGLYIRMAMYTKNAPVLSKTMQVVSSLF